MTCSGGINPCHAPSPSHVPQAVMIITYKEPENPEYQPFVQELKTAACTRFNFTMEDSLVGARSGEWSGGQQPCLGGNKVQGRSELARCSTAWTECSAEHARTRKHICACSLAQPGALSQCTPYR